MSITNKQLHDMAHSQRLDPSREPWRPDLAAAGAAGGWTKEIVSDRLVMAIRIIQATGGRVGPRAFGNSMPAVLRDWGDLLAQVETDHRDRNRTRLAPTSRQVTLADQALAWVQQFVTDENHRAAVNLWLLAKAVRRPWQELAQRKGLARETAKRRKERAIASIVYGLNAASMPVEEGR